ncbi:MAG: hypothetical protein RLZZ40_348 [Actinomycetota bacterium]|jgi:uncharacterized protein (DUF305 family)
MRKTILPLTLSALLAFGLTGCVINIGDTSNPQHGMMDGDSDTDAGALSMNDIMFAQMMIPHHQQAVDLATIAESNTKNVQVLDLAARIKNAQQPEIDQMQAWLDDSNSGMEMNHHMSMPGIVSDKDMAAIRAAHGAEFDTLFLTHMIAHHEGAVEMVNNLIANSANAKVKAMGQAIVKAQTAEIAEMKALLGS